jgi:hypothetical protein
MPEGNNEGLHHAGRDVWVPWSLVSPKFRDRLPDDAFHPGIITSEADDKDDGDKKDGKHDQGRCTVQITDAAASPCTIKCRKSALLERTHLACTPDVTALSVLNEATLLATLKARYLRQQIYTQCGPLVLVALNPYQPIADLYYSSPAPHHHLRMNENARLECGGRVDPHVYQVAHRALLRLQTTQRPQSIIVSGESGAGKTVSARHIMAHLSRQLTASIGSASPNAPCTSSTNEALMATNPLLEAFGNARTERNDNSSRFGKYVRIYITPDDPDDVLGLCGAEDGKGGNGWGRIAGAQIATFLLEKGRCLEAEPFHVLRMDDHQLGILGEQARTAGISDQDWRDVLTLLQAIKALLCDDIQRATNLLGLKDSGLQDDSDLQKDNDLQEDNDQDIHGGSLEFWLAHRTFRAPKEQRPLILAVDPRQRRDHLEALVKHMYQAMFGHLVHLLNRSLLKDHPHGHGHGRNHDHPHNQSGINGDIEENELLFIGILDIYGFERLPRNGLDQLCINYANEQLQQAFVRHHLVEEQRLFQEEGLPAVPQLERYADHGPMIDMVRGRVISLLDEECHLTQGTDRGFVAKLFHGNGDRGDLLAPGRFGDHEAFILRHFAYDVEYTADGMCDANKDRLPGDLLHVMQTSPLLLKISGQGVDEERKGSVLKHFDRSLQDLLGLLQTTECHYIRCIKPNDDQAPLKFDGRRVLTQLEACGVLATVQLAKAGYPGRWTYADLYARYPWLLSSPFPHSIDPALQSSQDASHQNNQDPSSELDGIREAVKGMFVEHVKAEKAYQFGKRLVFMQDGVLQLLDQRQRHLLLHTLNGIRRHYAAHSTRRHVRVCQFITACAKLHAHQTRILGRMQVIVKGRLQWLYSQRLLKLAYGLRQAGLVYLAQRMMASKHQISFIQPDNELGNEPNRELDNEADNEPQRELITPIVQDAEGMEQSRLEVENRRLQEHIIVLEAEVAKLRAQLDFCLTSSTLSMTTAMETLTMAPLPSNGMLLPVDELVDKLLGLLGTDDGHGPGEDPMQAAKDLYRWLHGHPDAKLALQCFLEHLEAHLFSPHSSPSNRPRHSHHQNQCHGQHHDRNGQHSRHDMRNWCWWVSNLIELCGYYSAPTTTVITASSANGKDVLLSLGVQTLQRICAAWFERLQVDLIGPLAPALLEHQSLPAMADEDASTSPSSSSLNEGTSWWSWLVLKRPKKPTPSLPDLLAAVRSLAHDMVSFRLESGVARSLWSWIMASIYRAALDQLLERRVLSWSQAVQVQYNLSLWRDALTTSIMPYWDLGADHDANADARRLGQVVKVLLLLPSLPQSPWTASDLLRTVGPNLGSAELQAVLRAYRPAVGNEDSLEPVQRLLEQLLPMANAKANPEDRDDRMTTMQLTFVPRTPPSLL